MATQATDLKLYLSGGQSHNDPVFEPYLSMGGYKSSILMSNNLLGNLFEEVPVGDAYKGRIDTRCIFLKNENASTNMTNLYLYISGKSAYEEIHFGISIPTSQTNGYVQRLQKSGESPYGVEFVEAYTSQTKVKLVSTLAKGDMIALWIQRKILSLEEMKVIDPSLTDLTLKLKSDLSFIFDWTG